MVTRISVNGTSFNVDETLPHPFWSGVNDGRWEPDTFRLFDRVLMPNWRFVDIGAWVGPTALYAARKVATVDAYECDPVALGHLRDVGLHRRLLAHALTLLPGVPLGARLELRAGGSGERRRAAASGSTG